MVNTKSASKICGSGLSRFRKGRTKMYTWSNFGPRGLLPRVCRLRLTLPLCRTVSAGDTSGWDLTPSSLFHHECDIFDDLQPLGIVMWNVRINSASRTFLLQRPCVGAIPPGETQDDQERPLRPAGEDVGPRRRSLRWVLPSPTPLRLDHSPPPRHFDTETGDR